VADTQGLPWPAGEPEPLRAAARQAASLGSALQGVRGRLSATDAQGWSGTAATAFDGTVKHDAAALGGAEHSFHQVARALTAAASKLEQAQDRVRHAARRLRDAREAAKEAAGHAASARSAATDAQAASLLDPSAALGGPLFAQATAADDAAARAESASAQAQQELERVERWAQHEAADAVRDAKASDEQAAAQLQTASSGAAGLGPTTGMPTAGLATGGGGASGNLGQFLRANLFNYWSGGPGHDYLPAGKMLQGGSFMYGTAKWMQAAGTAASWARVAPGGEGTLTAYAASMATAGFPTFNNGLLGRGLAKGLSALPGTSGAGGWLADASKATPVFRGLGVAGGVFSTAMDTKGLIDQGNPVDAFKKDGAGYVADVARTGFSASSTAFLIAPNPVTGGAVIATGTIWLGAEGWKHRAAIAHGVSSGADWVWDHSLTGEVWNHRADIGSALNSGLNTAHTFASDVGSHLDHGLDTATNIGGQALHDGGKVLDKGADLVGDLTPW
jgi:uncharacterized protein YukE